MNRCNRPVSILICALAGILLCGSVLLPGRSIPVLSPVLQPDSTGAQESFEMPTEAETTMLEAGSQAQTDFSIPDTQLDQPVVYGAPDPAVLESVRQAILREQQARQPGEVTLTFSGDCTLGTWPECPVSKNFNSVYGAAGSLTYPFDYVKAWFEADDYTIVNLEGALTTATKAAIKEWRFKGPPAYAAMLPASGIESVTLANNHSRDYFEEGYAQTLAALEANGIGAADTGRPLRFKAGEIDFSLLNYDCRTYRQETIGEELITQYCEEIRQEKRSDNIVIVAMHWGVEYRSDPEPYQTDYARRMVEAGADLIVGHHPHQLQGIEQLGDSFVVYSLGNFAFGGNEKAVPAALNTMLIRPRFIKESGVARCTGMAVVPCLETSAPEESVNNYRPLPLFGSRAQKVLDRLVSLSSRLPDGITQLECYSR